jgi:hypothetical protein
VILPALSIENAMMADAALHMMSLQIGPQTAAQLLGGECLADGTDATPFALDRKERSVSDRAGIDRPAPPFELASRQRMLLKNAAKGLIDHGCTKWNLRNFRDGRRR